MRVLVVGAGPTGLTAGVELARLGAEVQVIERRKSGSGFSRAVGILPSSIEILRRSGAIEPMLEEGIHIDTVRIFQSENLQAEIPINAENSSNKILLALAQDRTEHHLKSALESYGGKIAFGSELIDFSQTESGVKASISGKQEFECDFLIGADGIKSRVREKLDIAYPGIDLPEAWSIADVDVADWSYPTGFTICRIAGGGIVVVAPIEKNRCRVISNTPDAMATLPIPAKVLNVRREGTFKISVRQAEKYSSGRVFLAGDAAHCHSPVGGRGMNLGIADAADLARRLINGTDEGYHAARHIEGQRVLKFSERGRKFMTTTDPVRNNILKALLFTATRSNWLQRQISGQILDG